MADATKMGLANAQVACATQSGEICRNFGVVDQDPSGHGDQVNTAGAGPDQPHGGAHHLHLERGGQAHGLHLHNYRGDIGAFLYSSSKCFSQGERLCRGGAEQTDGSEGAEGTRLA